MPVLLVTLPPPFLAQLVALEVVGVIEGLVGVVAVAGIAVWFMPRRTGRGARALAAARHRYGDLVERSPLEPVEVGRAVGLFGTAALQALIPRFAREAGLVDGGRSSNHIDSRLDSSPWSPNTDSFWN